ncbi:MAG TPA: PEGA domain-containing protein [Planctomycetota bacterium]
MFARTLGLAPGLLALAGCTLVMQGTTQDVTFSSEPPGATVSVAGLTGVTPVTLTLPKEDHAVDVRRDGYRDAQVVLTRKISPWFIGSCVMGVLAAGTDILAGSWKEFDSTEVLVTLEALPGTVQQLAVAVESDPSGAEVLIGDVLYGRTPAELRLPWLKGDTEKTLTLRLAGYRPKSFALKRDERKIGPVALDLAPVRVATTFSSTPPGAEVRVGGRVLGRAPLTVDLEWSLKDGPRAVELALDGHHVEKKQLAPRQAELAAALREIVDEIPLKITVDPKGAKVTIDGAAAGEAPLEAKLSWSVSRVKHVVTVSYPGYATKKIELSRADAARPLDVRLSASP